MTLLLKDIPMGKLMSFPTIEMGIHCIDSQRDTGPALIWRSRRLKNPRCGIKQCSRNDCVEKKIYYVVVSTTNQLHVEQRASYVLDK